MLKGKWALVTGATAGLGLAGGQSLASTTICTMTASQGGARDRLRTQYGVEAIGVAADLSERTAIEAMMADLRQRIGGLDILVNNAVVRHFSPVETFRRRNGTRRSRSICRPRST